ncbi:MAG: hypothetical protein ABIJ09_06170 [Pseudomonadota bacterium]
MSVKGLQDLRARFMTDRRIDHSEVNSLIKEAKDGFLFFKHVSKKEKAELTELIEQHADKFEPGAKEMLAGFLGIRLVTPGGLAESLNMLKGAMEQARDGSGQVNLDRVASLIKGDTEAEAALEVVKREFATSRPVTVTTSCGGTSTSEVEEPARTLNLAKASSVFDALVDAKSKISDLDRDGNQVLSEQERAAASQLDGLSGRVARATVDRAARPEKVGTSC